MTVMGYLSDNNNNGWWFSSRELGVAVVGATSTNMNNNNNDLNDDCINNDNDEECYIQNEEEINNSDDDDDDDDDEETNVYDDDDDEVTAEWIEYLYDYDDNHGELRRLWDKRDLHWEAYFKSTDKEIENFLYSFFHCNERYDTIIEEEDDNKQSTFKSTASSFIPDSKTWMDLHEAYDIAVGGYPRSTIDSPPSVESGFLVPVEIKQISQDSDSDSDSSDISHAVYTTQPIKKGDLIWIPKQTGMLQGDEYRLFLALVSADWICDVLLWSYPIHTSEETRQDNAICCDMDESAILSSQELFDDEEYNVGCLEVDQNDDTAASSVEWVPGGCDVNMYALRDIDAGEKLVCNVSEFSIWWSNDWVLQSLQQKNQVHIVEEAFISNLQQESNQQLPPDTDEALTWESYFQLTFKDLEEAHGCLDQYSTEQKIPDKSSWEQLRETYYSVVGPSISQINYPESMENGFFIDVEVRQSEGKGRGVFVTQPVKQGELIWAPKQLGRFHNGAQYRKFVASVPSDLVCDVLQWSYVQPFGTTYPSPSKTSICTDLDECCLINNADEVTEVNMGCIPGAEWIPGGCEFNNFATRDIEAGEELLCDYEDFALPYGWQFFDL